MTTFPRSGGALFYRAGAYLFEPAGGLQNKFNLFSAELT
jgi:hypothetical protein